MVDATTLEATVNTLLGDIKLSQFSLDWIVKDKRVTEDSVREVYCFLIEHGVSKEKIAAQAHLLGRDPETIERNYQALKQLGLTDDKIASNAHLLGRDPETIERNYQHHIRLLRQDYQDRVSGKSLLINQAALLGIPTETINANVQFMHSIGINYNNGFLLGTKPQTKRQKMAWMLRELFDYREVPEEQREDTMNKLYCFIRDNPRTLVSSINTLEKTKDKLREKAGPYKAVKPNL